MIEQIVPKQLTLPKVSYGSLCNKMLKDFMEHHGITQVELPQPSDKTHEVLSKIFLAMLHSMGEEKLDKGLKEAQDYINTLPPAVR